MAALGGLVVGAAVGLCSVLLHDHLWGLLLGVATTLAVMVALPGGAARLGFAIGWVAVLWRATTERPEGDYLVSSDANGYVLLGFGLVVLAGGFTGLVGRRVPDGDSGGVGTAP
ncbi:hypothetical protein ASE01_09275 [Nocardioides sp. Root190]|uniref:hypothetical protein n=1 Tax=Nocardioides sp. Root190 TaxID=1736488 RepID=UPI0006FFB91B|nr:hypothetical protein [Nocardioides sp. Root190]KRB76951.1 hypothetical protein ASE01_09275 [Nocardioides sp. Root190]